LVSIRLEFVILPLLVENEADTEQDEGNQEERSVNSLLREVLHDKHKDSSQEENNYRGHNENSKAFTQISIISIPLCLGQNIFRFIYNVVLIWKAVSVPVTEEVKVGLGTCCEGCGRGKTLRVFVDSQISRVRA